MQGDEMAAPRPQNVIVIMADQLRASMLELYGHEQCRTPNLTALAGHATVFDHAYAPYPTCVPSRVALWTGRWPHVTGSRSNDVYMSENETSVPQVLHDRGWRTALIGKNHCFDAQQIKDVFDIFYPVGHAGPQEVEPGSRREAARDWVRAFATENRSDAFASATAPYALEDHASIAIAEQSARFISDNRDAPFLMWVSFPDPHSPYQVPEPYASMYPPEDVKIPTREPSGYPGKPERFKQFAARLQQGATEEKLRRAIATYQGMVSLMDEAVGRILRSLDESGLRESTLVVFTADHGDYMGEHGLVRKGASLYESLVRVPLIVASPTDTAHGVRSSALVNLLDVAPTIYSQLGVDAPDGLSGVALPLAEEAVHPRDAILAEVGHERGVFDADAPPEPGPEPSPRDWQVLANHPLRMVRTRRWKYIYPLGGTGDELYDLDADPGELVNLADDPELAPVVDEHRKLLLDLLIDSDTRLPSPRSQSDRSRHANLG